MKQKLSAIESKILTVLVKSQEYMTTAQIAKDAGVSWNTALAHLKAFLQKGWVAKEGDTQIYWIAVFEE